MERINHKSARIALAVSAIALFAMAAPAQAAKTVSASASAVLVDALAITKSADLDFGRLSSDTSGGTAVISTAGARSVTGDVVEEGGSPAAAGFDVTGEAGLGYDITLPTSIVLNDGGSNNMTVNTFTDSNAGSGTLTGGTDSFTVGATLNVGASQATGTYTGSFDVSVAYQ